MKQKKLYVPIVNSLKNISRSKNRNSYVRHFLFTTQNSTKPSMLRDFHIDIMEKKESVDANAPVNT